MRESIDLSMMDCYAGKRKAEVMDATPAPNPSLYLQFVEGCGYDVYELTPDEADQLASMLVRGAQRAREQPARIVLGCNDCDATLTVAQLEADPAADIEWQDLGDSGVLYPACRDEVNPDEIE